MGYCSPVWDDNLHITSCNASPPATLISAMAVRQGDGTTVPKMKGFCKERWLILALNDLKKTGE